MKKKKKKPLPAKCVGGVDESEEIRCTGGDPDDYPNFEDEGEVNMQMPSSGPMMQIPSYGPMMRMQMPSSGPMMQMPSSGPRMRMQMPSSGPRQMPYRERVEEEEAEEEVEKSRFDEKSEKKKATSVKPVFSMSFTYKRRSARRKGNPTTMKSFLLKDSLLVIESWFSLCGIKENQRRDVVCMTEKNQKTLLESAKKIVNSEKKFEKKDEGKSSWRTKVDIVHTVQLSIESKDFKWSKEEDVTGKFAEELGKLFDVVKGMYLE